MDETNINNLPLVSVDVVTYNSADTIIEALDSVAAQTYPNLELIVSDDCSKDNTVELVQNWIDAHKERFVRTMLITVPKNTGVSANYNRAANANRGEWVKDLDGDDMLMPNCVEEYVMYINQHSNAYFCFSRPIYFGGTEKSRESMCNFLNCDIFQKTPDEQLQYLMNSNFIYSGAFFYNRAKYNELGITNDERLPLLEDWPKWINILQAGGTFTFIDKELTKYRMSENSLCTSQLYSKSYTPMLSLLSLYYKVPYMVKKSKRKAWYLKRNSQYHLNMLHPKTAWHILLYTYRKCMKLFHLEY